MSGSEWIAAVLPWLVMLVLSVALVVMLSEWLIPVAAPVVDWLEDRVLLPIIDALLWVLRLPVRLARYFAKGRK